MKNLLAIVIGFSFLSISAQTQAVHLSWHNPDYDKCSPKVFLSYDMKEWQVIEPTRESWLHSYYTVGFIVLGVTALVAGILWARSSVKSKS